MSSEARMTPRLHVTRHAIERYAQRILGQRVLARTHSDLLRDEIVARVLAGAVTRRSRHGDLVASDGAYFMVADGNVVTVLVKRRGCMHIRERQ